MIDTADLAERMERAIENLTDLAVTASTPTERIRLAAKSEGVALALSYLRDQPDIPSVPVAELRAALDAANDERIAARDERNARSRGSVNDNVAVIRTDGEAYGIRRAIAILDGMENPDA